MASNRQTGTVTAQWPQAEGAGIVVDMEPGAFFTLSISDGATGVSYNLTRPIARAAFALFRDGGKASAGTGDIAVIRAQGLVVVAQLVSQHAQIVGIKLDPADLDTVVGFLRDFGLAYYGNLDDVPTTPFLSREIARAQKRYESAQAKLASALQAQTRAQAEVEQYAAALADYGVSV